MLRSQNSVNMRSLVTTELCQKRHSSQISEFINSPKNHLGTMNWLLTHFTAKFQNKERKGNVICMRISQIVTGVFSVSILLSPNYCLNILQLLSADSEESVVWLWWGITSENSDKGGSVEQAGTVKTPFMSLSISSKQSLVKELWIPWVVEPFMAGIIQSPLWKGRKLFNYMTFPVLQSHFCSG